MRGRWLMGLIDSRLAHWKRQMFIGNPWCLMGPMEPDRTWLFRFAVARQGTPDSIAGILWLRRMRIVLSGGL